MSILTILFILFSSSFQMPYDIKNKGEQGMYDASISYADIQKYQELYFQEYGERIKHPLEDTILRPTKTVTTYPAYLNLISLQAKYLEIFPDFAMCYTDMIDKGECCPYILPNKRMETGSNGWTLIDYGNSDADSLVYEDEKNHYAIFRHDGFKKVVITYPATRGAKQGATEVLTSMLTSFDFKKYGNLKIKIANYFGKRASDIMSKAFSKSNIKNMRLSDGYQIIFTGHSLGAAMAAATCLFALDQEHITRARNHPIVVTYGQPRTGNEAFALTLMKESELIYRIVNDGDLITQIPPYSLGYVHTQGKFQLIRTSNSIPKEFVYDVNKIDDSQEVSLWKITTGLTDSMDKHTYYFGSFIGSTCA